MSYNKNDFKGYKISPGKQEETSSNSEDTEKEKIEVQEKTKPGLISFDHEVTDFEIKLKYLNLKDTSGGEYGRFFPPIRSKLVIIDEEGREFIVNKAGNNQISGNLMSLIRTNGLKPGDIIRIEYDRDERSSDGRYIIRIKLK